MAITAALNRLTFNDAEEVRALFGDLIGKAVDDAFLTGTETKASFQFDDDNEMRKIGYVGPKRYVRVTITPSGNNSGNIFIAGCWVTQPLDRPSSNPPA